MPEYEYVCTACGHRWTIVCKMKDHKSSPKCPKCGKRKTEQTWEDGRAPGWHFAGSDN